MTATIDGPAFSADQSTAAAASSASVSIYTITGTDGAFDVAITRTPETVQPYQGSAMKATLGSASWIGATLAVVAKTGGVYSFGGSSSTSVTGSGLTNVNVILSGVTGPGTYTLGPAMSQLLVTTSGLAYSSSQSGSSGSVVVTRWT